jgi:hypothetical protein
MDSFKTCFREQQRYSAALAASTNCSLCPTSEFSLLKPAESGPDENRPTKTLLGLHQESNNEKLEQVRQTVDEKLHTTLEKRLTDSFGLSPSSSEECSWGWEK